MHSPLGTSAAKECPSATATEKSRPEVGWMAALGQRDEAAFLQLYRQYGEQVLAVCMRILRDRHAAEDVLSEVFWEIWRDPQRYDSSRSTPQTYLLMVARSRAIDRLRESGRRARVLAEASAVASIEGSFGSPEAPESNCNRQEERRLIRSALDALDANQQKVLELAFFEGMSHQQIAVFLDHPLGTVKSRIRQGLIHLRAKLASTFPERFQP
jgi:RNA polymerase sigma-70 factor (ECF subfamily)